MNLAARTLRNIEAELTARWHAAHCSAGIRTSQVVWAEIEGAQALYATAKACGDVAEMDAQRARGAALVAELNTMIALADEAGGVYEEGE